MKTFLDQVAEYAFTKYAENASNICYVLPSRRAGLFLKRSLSKQIGKTSWAPSVYSIEDFILELSGFKVIDPILLQFKLFEVHKEIEGDDAQAFNEFLKWSSVMLNDFNELDLYLADAHQLFGNLTEAKAISLWNLDKKPLTEFEARYLHFFNSLSKYYELLTEGLISKKEMYQGLAYRKLAETEMLAEKALPWDTFLLVGFNALTLAEERIFENLKKIYRVEFLWDTDSYYINNNQQEAGRFVRQYFEKSEKNSYSWVGNYFKETKKEIQVLGVAQNVGQAKLAGQLLKELADNNVDLMNTAVVLNDQSVVLPLLNSMDDSLKKFNLTMGYPISSTPMYRLINLIINLHENSARFAKSIDGVQQFYFRDVIAILDHNYVQEVDSNERIFKVLETIRKVNKAFLSPNEIIKELNQNGRDNSTSAILFGLMDNNPSELVNAIILFFKGLQNHMLSKKGSNNSTEEKQPDLDVEFLYNFSKVFFRLRKILEEYPFVDGIQTLHELFNQIVQSMSIPFYGEPLQGLQVMGMLETRTLDFENIIMLSANEDFLPSGNKGNSFVPFEFRRKYNLPTHHDRNAVFAYHFYRLLQRAKKVSLIYNTEQGDLGGGGISRFITQLLYEMPKYNPEINITEKILAVKPSNTLNPQDIEIPKSKEIMDRLRELAKKGFSASAMSSLKNCSLQYYFTYVARLRELSDVEETIESNTLGTVVHEVLKDLYLPYKREILNEGLIKSMKSTNEKLVRQKFSEVYEQGDIDHGKNLLIVKVAESFVKNYLDREVKYINSEKRKGNDVILQQVEDRFDIQLNLKLLGQNEEVVLNGIFDRVDQVGDLIRILDYKTGIVTSAELNIKNWDTISNEKKMDKSFQLLYYTFIYLKQKNAEINKVQPGIISMRNLGPYALNMSLPDKEPVSLAALEPFSQLLESLLADLFNPEVSFHQTEQVENCKYCPYTSICNRMG